MRTELKGCRVELHQRSDGTAELFIENVSPGTRYSDKRRNTVAPILLEGQAAAELSRMFVHMGATPVCGS